MHAGVVAGALLDHPEQRCLGSVALQVSEEAAVAVTLDQSHTPCRLGENPYVNISLLQADPYSAHITSCFREVTVTHLSTAPQSISSQSSSIAFEVDCPKVCGNT
jgi:hypothetical protein